MSYKQFFHNLFKILDCVGKALTLPKQQILDSSKQKECADYNSKFDENGGSAKG